MIRFVERYDFAIDAALADAANNQLRDLRAEVDNQNRWHEAKLLRGRMPVYGAAPVFRAFSTCAVSGQVAPHARSRTSCCATAPARFPAARSSSAKPSSAGA